MSSCLSGGGRTYGLELDIVKSAAAAAAVVSRSSSHSSSSSPSSTLSEASNSPLAISTKRPRTPRKRPNQTYNEAAALLSTAYPAVFPARALRSSHGSPRPRDSFSESPELLPPFPPLSDAGFLLRDPPLAALTSHPEPKKLNSLRATSVCRSPPGIDFREASSPAVVDDDDFDAESMLDEEVEEGMDSIMGTNLQNENGNKSGEDSGRINPCLGSLMVFGLGGRFEFGVGLGLAGGCIRRALRCADDWDWWRSPTVAIRDIVPKFKKLSAGSEKKKKKKKKVEEKEKELEDTTIASAATTTSSLQENSPPNLGLKLDYDDILKAWSDRGCPYSDGPPESPESLARLAQIDLSSEVATGGGLREAIVQRYKEKRRTRLFSKKIRYQVRKVNADRRPRMKGRFVRKPSLLHETIEEESP